jgi:hypothetical protein
LYTASVEIIARKKGNFKVLTIPKIRLYNPEGIDLPPQEGLSEKHADEFAISNQRDRQVETIGNPEVITNSTSNLSQQSLIDRTERIPMVDNSVFRLLIWRDMFANYINEKPLIGFDLGEPLRSISLEILDLGRGEWSRDGWISPHNSYLHMLYRGGIIGFMLVVGMFSLWVKMAYSFVQMRSVAGILLSASLVSWLIAANFGLIFELPYTAIPIWSLYGVTFGYWRKMCV